MISPKNARVWHRRIGLLFSVIVLASALSGLLHTLMAMTQPPPPPPPPNKLGAAVAAVKLTPAEALAKIAPTPRGDLRACTLVELDGRPLYRLRFAADPNPVCIRADSGEPDTDADERLAARIATAHLGGKPVRKTARLTAYDREYIAIFRTLPVYRFDVDDARRTRVYVSTDTGAVTRATDDALQFEANTFGLLHKYAFIPDRTWRNAAQVLAMGAVCLIALSGIALWWVTRPKKSGA